MDFEHRQVLRSGYAIDPKSALWPELFDADWMTNRREGEHQGVAWTLSYERANDLDLLAVMDCQIASEFVEVITFKVPVGRHAETVMIMGGVTPQCKFRYRVRASSHEAAALLIKLAIGDHHPQAGMNDNRAPTSRDDFAGHPA